MRAASAMAASSARRIRDAAWVSMAVSIAKSVRLCRRQVDGDGYGVRYRRLTGPFAAGAQAEVDAADHRLAGHVRAVAVDRKREGQGDRFGDAVQRQPAGRDIGVAAF